VWSTFVIDLDAGVEVEQVMASVATYAQIRLWQDRGRSGDIAGCAPAVMPRVAAARPTFWSLLFPVSFGVPVVH